MAQIRLWQDLPTTAFDALDPQRSVALLPVGAVEQHGPHLPLSTDAVIAEEIAHRAAALVPEDLPLLVLPTMAVGKSNEHIDFPGTLTLSTRTLHDLWLELGESVARAGLRKLVLLNAHGGQPQIMEIVCRELRVTRRMFAVAANWWSLGLPEGLVPPEEQRHGIHGGTVETSMMLHLRPALVNMAEARDFRSVLPDLEARYERLRLIGGPSAGWQAQDLHPAGVAGNAAAATAALGARIVGHVAEAFAKLLAEVSDYPLESLKTRGPGCGGEAG